MNLFNKNSRPNHRIILVNSFWSKQFLLAFILAFFGACSRIQTLNLEPHSFGEKGRKIVWLQVAGLSEEHLALLKFSREDFVQKIELEKFQCLGKMWSHNYFNLRPPPNRGFFSQMVGSRDIVGNCSDLKHRPIWKILEQVQFKVGIVENSGPNQYSLGQYFDCSDKRNFFHDISFWRMMAKSPKDELGKLFHYQENISLGPGIFYDKACQPEKCFSSFFGNVRTIWDAFSKIKEPSLFIVRDFSFYEALKLGNFENAKQKLDEVSKIVEFIRNHSNNTTILLTTSASLLFEFPKQGKNWANFMKEGKNIIFHESSLLSSAWVSGPGAENFCGIYGESEILKRILWFPKKKVFNWDFFKQE